MGGPLSGLYPGAAGALADHASFVEEKEWAVLAAIALRAGDPDALGALASAADDWRAFAWMWAVLNPDDPRHLEQLSERLAAKAAVPKNGRDAVGGFVLTPDPLRAMSPGAYHAHLNQPNSAPMLRRAAQEGVLARLNPNSDLARDLARAVLDAEEEGRYWPGLQHAAFDALGASKRKVDRSEVLERASALVPRERLRPLAGMASPLQKGEEEELLRHLGEALPISGPCSAGGLTEEDYWTSARDVALVLSAGGIAELLRGSWAGQEADRERLFGGGFVARLGAERLLALLASDLDEAVRRHMIRSAAAQLPIEVLGDLGRWTHDKLDPDWSRPLRDRLSSDARPPHYGERSPLQERALAALGDFALACDDPGAAADYAARLAPGEAPPLTEEALASGPPPERVGLIAGALLARAEPGESYPTAPEGFRADVAGMLDLYADDGDRASFLAGMLRHPADAGEEGDAGPADLSFLGDRILGHPRATAVLAEAGHGFDLVPAAYEAEDPKEAFLQIAEAAVEHIGEDALETVLLKCGWAELDEDRYGRFVAALRRRPYALLREAASALASLPEPDAEAVPTGHLRTVLEAALDTAPGDLAGMVGEPYDERLRDLLDQRDTELGRLALRWALALEPEDVLLGLLVEKRASTRGLGGEFAEVLGAHARLLADRARDASLASEERAEALKLAQAAAPEEARAAAFDIAEFARAKGLSIAAASVLAETDARPGDEEKLRRLIEEEGDAEAGRLLAAALRNISSGTLARALDNLRSLAGLPPGPDEDPRVLVPVPVWDARFLGNVDAARRTSAGDPGAHVNALVVLADLLVDIAVAERHYADPDHSPLGKKGPAQASALRENAGGRPDTGELLKRPNLVEGFPWFSHVTVLRKMRGAHPAPLGSTDPVRVGDEDADHARRLFRDVAAGWEDSMRATGRLLRKAGP